MKKTKKRKVHGILGKGRTHSALNAFGYTLGFLVSKKKKKR